MSSTAPELVLDESGDEPPVLAGRPTALSGQIKLHNPGSSNVVLREVSLRDPDDVLRLRSPRQRLKPHILRPDHRGPLKLTIALDPATPSGEYRAELNVGGHELPVVLLVAEVLDARVEPATVVVFNQPGTAQRRRLLLENTGNITFTLGDPGPVELHVEGQDALVRVALDERFEAEKPEPEGVAVALLAVNQSERRRSGTVEVRIPGGPVELEPGDRAFVELEITLADEVATHRRHRGRFPVLTRDVTVVVVPAGVRPPERATRSPARATRPAGKGTRRQTRSGRPTRGQAKPNDNEST